MLFFLIFKFLDLDHYYIFIRQAYIIGKTMETSPM